MFGYVKGAPKIFAEGARTPSALPLRTPLGKTKFYVRNINTVDPSYNELSYKEIPVITNFRQFPAEKHGKIVTKNPLITKSAITKSRL